MNDYIHLDFAGDGGTTEIALMVLDHYLYTRDVVKLERYLPLVTGAMDFFRLHFPTVLTTDASGRQVETVQFWPTQALEMFWCPFPLGDECVVNDMPTVSSLMSLVDKTLRLVPSHLLDPSTRSTYAAFRAALPALPLSADQSRLAPAERYLNKTHNSETPELYAVHPNRVFTVGTELTGNVSLAPAIAAWHANPLTKWNTGWGQGILNAALLGLADEAWAMAVQRALYPPAPGYRFQGFWSEMGGSEPTTDTGSNLNIALHLMLLQNGDDDNDTIILFPAWPCELDVHFRLEAARTTVVEVDYSHGKLHMLHVKPASRRSAVSVARCVAAA